jgi:hypothetical protein
MIGVDIICLCEILKNTRLSPTLIYREFVIKMQGEK